MVYAKRLAETYDLILVARRRDRLESLATELASKNGALVEVIVADLTSATDLAAVAERISSELRLELLINNAGFGTAGLFWEQPLQGQQQMHLLHVNATVALTHAALSTMVSKDKGAIINVCSVGAFVRRSGAVSYGATKSWMAFFTEGILLDLQKVGSSVKVQALCPGFTYSEFHDGMSKARTEMAGPSLWLRAEDVVDESLRELQSGKLFVIPNWRYKVIVALLNALPISLRLALERPRRSS